MTFRTLLFFVLVSFVGTLAQSAVAQTISVNSMTIERREGHDLKQIGPTDINYEDCVENDFFGVKLTTMNVSSAYGLQVWGGTDEACATATGRKTAGDLCWLVYSDATVPTSQIDIPVRNIIPHASGVDGTREDCESEKQSAFTIRFILFMGDTQASAAPAVIQGKYDLKGPNPPKATGIGIGDTRLYPTWEASTDDPKSYRLYCEETGAEDPFTATCIAPTLVAGERAPDGFEPNAQATQVATEGEVNGLTNKRQYACAIGTVDTLLNVGKLSEIVCGVPQPILGYFKSYRVAGGQGGGGYCAFGRGVGNKAAALTLLGLTAVFFAARRRRRRKESP